MENENNSQMEVEEDLPVQNSMDLFSKMLEEQLRLEEERMKNGGGAMPAPKPRQPYKPLRKNNTTSVSNSEEAPKQEQVIEPLPVVKEEIKPEITEQPKPQADKPWARKKPVLQKSKPVAAETTQAPVKEAEKPANKEQDAPASEEEEISTGPSSMDKFMELLAKAEQSGLANASSSAATSSGDLSSRLTDNNWKTRKEAYEELAKVLSSGDDGSKYEQYIAGIAQDKNALALDAGLEAIAAFVDKYKFAHRSAEGVVPSVIAKCLTGKPGTLKRATDILLSFIDTEALEVVTSEIIKGFQHNTPKVRASCINILSQAVRRYGLMAFPIANILKNFVKVFEDTDPKVRAEGVLFAKELFRWMKESLKPHLANLRSAQQAELDKAFAELASEPSPVPEKPLKSQATNKANNKVLPKGKMEIKVEDLADPVEVLSKVPKNFHEAIAATKWQERKEVLDQLNSVINKPKLMPGNYSDIATKLLEVAKSDANVAVWRAAFESLALLTKGLKAEFTSYSKSAIPIAFEKLKEKKAPIVEQLFSFLDACESAGITLTDMLDDISSGCKSKTPAVKVNTLNWLEKILSTKSRSDIVRIYKTLCSMIVEQADDKEKDVREAACKTLGRMIWVMGEKDVQPLVSKLDELKLQKAKEHLATLGPSPAGSSSSAPEPEFTEKKAPAKPKIAPKPAEESKPAAKESRPAPSKPALSKTLPKPSTASSAASKKPAPKGGKGKPSAAEEDIKPSLTQEDALQKAAEIVPETVLSLLESKNYKERLEGVEQFHKFVDSADVESNAEVFARLLAAKPGWKETNVQVQIKAFETLSLIAQKAPKAAKLVAHLSMTGLTSKIATAKVNDAVKACWMAFAEHASPQYVFLKLYKELEDQKNPKIIADAIQWMSSCVTEFGLKHIKVDKLIEFIKQALNNTNPTVKKNTIALLCVMKRFLGESLLNFLSDVKPALLSSIQKEFESVPSEPIEPTRKLAGDDDDTESGSGTDMLPRQDISSKLGAKDIAEGFANKQWQAKLQSLNRVQSIIVEANKRIAPNVGDLFSELKKKLDDANVKIITTTLSLLSLLSEAMGPAIEKYCKIVLTSVVSKLADNNKTIRAQSLETLEAWVKEVTLGPMLKYFPKGLTNEKGSPSARKDALTFIAKHFATVKGKQFDNVQPIVKLIIDSLSDPKSDTRKIAESLLPAIIPHVGDEEIRKNCRDLKPAIKQSVCSIVDRYCAAISSEEFTTTVVQDEPPAKQSTQSSIAKDQRQNELTKSFSKTQPVPSKVQSQPEEQQPIMENNMKESRAKQEKKTRWFFESPRPEHVEMLQEFAGQCFSSEIQDLLFSTNFKKQVVGIEMIQTATESCKRATVDSLDVILMYATLKFQEANTSVTISTVEMLSKVFSVAASTGYQFSDYEAGLFLPMFVEKLGQNNASMRETMNELLKSCHSICAPKKILSYIMEGLKSKNARTRADCITEIGALIQQSGLSTVPNMPNLVAHLVKALADCEATRTAALNVFVEVYKVMNNDFWPLLEQVHPQAKQMISDKLKKISVELESQRAKASAIPRPASKNPTQQSMSSSRPNTTMSVESTSTSLQLTERTAPSAAEIQYLETDITSLAELKRTLGYIPIQSNSEEVVVAALKRVDRLLKAMPMFVTTQVSAEMVNVLTDNIKIAFEEAAGGRISIRIGKYLLHTMIQNYHAKRVVEFIDTDTLTKLINQLLRRLLDENLPSFEDGHNLLKALNSLMLKILENSNRTYTYAALLKLLSQSHRDKDMRKYTELVVKCLLKLTKALSTTIDRIDIDRVLLELHQFLCDNPPTIFRSQVDDLPLRTVKTILNEVVKIKGEAIRSHLSFIPTHQNPLIVSYIDLMIRNIQRAPDGEKSSLAVSRPVSRQPAAVDVSHQINAIMAEISNKSTTQSGLFKMYRFKKDNPEADLHTLLSSRANAQLVEYILRQLEKIRTHELSKEKAAPKTQDQPQLSKSVALPSTSAPAQDPSMLQRSTSIVDTFRAQKKLKELAESQNSSAPATSGSAAFRNIATSSVDSLKKRLNILDAERITSTASPTASPSKPIDLENLKKRLRNRSQPEGSETASSSSLESNPLRARILASTTTVKNREEDKENRPEDQKMDEEVQ